VQHLHFSNFEVAGIVKIRTYTDKTGSYASNAGQVQKMLDAASAFFSDRIVGNATIELNVTVAATAGAYASAGGRYTWTGDASSNLLNIPAQKILQGLSYSLGDGNLALSPQYMGDLETWLANPSSAGGSEAFQGAKHELLHVLGFGGGLDANTGRMSDATGFTSHFDPHVVVSGTQVAFGGTYTKLITGGTVPLAPLGRYYGIYHVDDDSTGVEDLMGWVSAGAGKSEQELSTFDQVILKDLGYTLKTTLVSKDGHTFVPGAGTKVSGTAATDTAYFAGKATDYSMSTAWDGTVTVSSKIDGNITTGMNSIERIKFSDTAMAYDADIGAGQVYRLYQAAFNRKPDLEGLGYWIKAIDAGYTITQIAESFVIQPQLTKLNNADFIESLYQNALHRPSDDGKSYWVGRLEDGMSRAAVLASFSDSAENKVKVILDVNSTEAKAYRMYQAAFDRQPDLWGHIAWSDLLKQNKIDINGMAAGFIGSDEFKSRYGANLTDAQYVSQLYANVLHREPEAAGQAFWEGWLKNGMTREHVLAQFSESPENRARIVGVWQDGFEYTPYMG
jgi:predicted component of type VI protein secretion system